MFKRKIESTIKSYFEGNKEKILVIDGARQIGKSYIIRKLSKQYFQNYIEINLKDDFDSNKFFSQEKINNSTQFYLLVSSLYGSKLGNKENTIIFLDEIQVYPHLLTMLKQLNNESRFTYIASGSLLGVTLKHTFIPMGAIKEEKMYQLDFEEFLWANDVGKDVIDYAKQCFEKLQPINENIHQVLLSKFKEYLLCGGLPDAVKEFVFNKNVFEMRKIHQTTYTYYKDDCSQYDQINKLKISRIYEMMASLMQNKVKRIQANNIVNNKKDTLQKYEDEFDYLVNSGIAIAVRAVSNPKFPLLESSSKNLIKLYYNDVGLLSNILYKTNIDTILNNNKGINLGSIYESVVANELKAHGHDLYYFDSKKVGEVDFLINDYNAASIIPIEVKSGNDQYNFRALPKLVKDDGSYNIPFGYVLGNKNIIKKEGNIITIPVYLVMFL